MTCWSRMFSGRADQVREARRFVVAVLDGHGLGEAAELVVSELATNAVEHTVSGEVGGSFVVEVEAESGRVRVAVVDMGAATEPAALENGPADASALDGRGLFIVGTVADKWGTELLRVGRRVWAELGEGAR